MCEYYKMAMQIFLVLAHTTPCDNLGLFVPVVLYKYIGRFASNLTFGGMGKHQKYLHASFQMYTPMFVGNHKVWNFVTYRTSRCKQKSWPRTWGHCNLERQVQNSNSNVCDLSSATPWAIFISSVENENAMLLTVIYHGVVSFKG